MRITAIASPNHGARPSGIVVDCIVLHADASNNARASIDWIKNPKSKVSYHALIDRDGTVYRFVEASRRAQHAGISEFHGRPDCNNYSIGLSFANKCDGYELFTDEQYEVGSLLCAQWIRVYPKITLDRITTHAAVAMPRGRKNDPGPAFDLPRYLGMVRNELAKPPMVAA